MPDRQPPRLVALANRLHAHGASRRQVLRSATLLAAGALASGLALAQQAPPAPRVRFTADPFALGVGSGYPRPDRVSLWTRLAPQPLDFDGGVQPDNIDVTWEIARDERFSTAIAKGRVRAVPELGHSVHAEATGLDAGRWYFYRFRAGDAVSPIGRTRTADAADADVKRLKLGLSSCQHYEQGYFNAYRHLADENIDAMLCVGDYIYENSWGDDLVRRHAGGLLHTLGEYRQRHAQYKTDPDLRALHGSVPWVVTWDDHEVDNDYADDRSEHLDPNFLARRAAAYQAYFEHMALPPAMWANGADMAIYTALDFGRLARIYLLDNRQYRSPQACPDPFKRGGSTDVAPGACSELADPDRTLLGGAQERWLDDAFASSKQRWNIIGQQTLMTHYPTPRDGGEDVVWSDGWDGYPHAREKVLRGLETHAVANPMVLGGDLHATVVADIHRDGAHASPIVAAEFCGTSISAQGSTNAVNDARTRHNPHVHFADMSRRGYLTCEFTAARAEVAVRVVGSVKTPTTSIETQRRFVVEAGRAGVVDA